MKKYIIAVLCVCTALTSYAGTPKFKRFGGRLAERQILESLERGSGISAPFATVSLEQIEFKGLPTGLVQDMAKEMLDRTRPTRSLLYEQGSLSCDTNLFHYRSGQGPAPLREEVFSKVLLFVDELTAEMNFGGYEAPFMEIPEDLSRYFELSAQVSKLIERTDRLAKRPREGAVKEEEKKLYAKQYRLLEEMKTILERLPNSAHGSFGWDVHEFLDIPDYYVGPRTYLAKFDGVANRFLAQEKRMQEGSSSPFFTMNPQERINYAKTRTLEIIDSQEKLREVMSYMDQPWLPNMARLDFVLCVYKYYYSTLAGHSIPVLPYYYEKGLESNFEAGGLMKSFKPGWADKERALFYEQPAPFSKFPGNVSPADVYPTERVAAPQATQVVDLPRANPSFEGLSGEKFATLAKTTLEETRNWIEIYSKIFYEDTFRDKELQDSYLRIYKDGCSVVEQMSKEIEALIEKGSTLSPVAAEVQLGKILEIQTELRTFAAKYMDKWSASSILTLDYFLSQYRYLCATSAGIFATMPTPIDYPHFPDNINNILEKLQTRYRNGNPMISLMEFNSRRSSEPLN